ncbi:response regulator transcription factor [Kordia algicida OT-1]|uniref:Response regulator receiver n=1 Tax=Kordia algicida OT-1 TaxID=391587 RepID=A9DTZ7_9FLAO|nr:response regulator transcription factor [Kordia algicida]EDP96241.1 response regulator receiver [Kordia algicida OT-1]
MENLHILLLEDDLLEATNLLQLLTKHDYRVTHAKTIIEAHKHVKNTIFDMTILDIMIDGKPQGIDLAVQLAKEDIHIPFIFLTSIHSRAIFDKAKYTKPFSYLLKPFNEMELLYTIELAIGEYHKQKDAPTLASNNTIITPEFLFVKDKMKVVKVTVDTINYIKVDGKYCHLVCDESSYLIKLSLSKTKEVLANPNFTYTHRNYLVNIQKVKEIYTSDRSVMLENEELIPISSRYLESFLKDSTFFK